MMDLTARQEEILDVAIALIADRGIQKLTIRNLAGEIGISEPAIYRHFDSKYAILMAVLDCFQEIASEVLVDVEGREVGALEKIEAFMMDRCRRCSQHPKLAKVMFSEENFQDDDRLSERILSIMHQHREKMFAIITAGQKRGEIRPDLDPLSLFRIVFGPLRLLIKQWCLSGFKFDLESEGKKLWETERKLLEVSE